MTDTCAGHVQAEPSQAESSQAEQDFAAALHEIKSNLEVRRLMFVISNILVPASAVALIDSLTGSAYPASLRWLPEAILPVIGALLTLAGILVAAILARCHFGLVVNGNKMDLVNSGDLQLKRLNWLGVTTNFVALTALYAAAGFVLLLATLGLGVWSWLGGVLLFLGLMGFLPWNHSRANRLSQKLSQYWQHGPVALSYREEHLRESLQASTTDISVIVTMAVAFFAGTFNCMSSVGALNPELNLRPSIAALQDWSIPLLAGFSLLALLLSDRMVVRLRIALADHADQLAQLRQESDNPWRFKPQERTYLLYMLLHLLTSVSALLLVWPLYGQWLALVMGIVLFIAGLLWYPWQLTRSARKKKRS